MGMHSRVQDCYRDVLNSVLMEYRTQVYKCNVAVLNSALMNLFRCGFFSLEGTCAQLTIAARALDGRAGDGSFIGYFSGLRVETEFHLGTLYSSLDVFSAESTGIGPA